MASSLVAGACGFDVDRRSTLKVDLRAEANAVDSLVAERAPEAEVEVHATSDGRQIAVRFPSAPDSLAEMGFSNQPDTAEVIAQDLTRLLMESYSGFDKVSKVEIEFAQESETFFPATSFVLDEEDFSQISENAPDES